MLITEIGFEICGKMDKILSEIQVRVLGQCEKSISQFSPNTQEEARATRTEEEEIQSSSRRRGRGRMLKLTPRVYNGLKCDNFSCWGFLFAPPQFIIHPSTFFFIFFPPKYSFGFLFPEPKEPSLLGLN